MAERLCDAAGDLIPTDECETLLFSGRFPESFDAEQFKELLGVQKHSGYLNFFYGIVVEEALQLAVEREVHKRAVSNGNQYQDDFSEEAFFRIYRRTRTELLQNLPRRDGLRQRRRIDSDPMQRVSVLAIQVPHVYLGQG